MATEVMEVENVGTEFNRKDYVFAMRKAFCPEEMVDQENGELIEEYFRPKATTGDVWNKEDQERLFLGIRKFGVGEWPAIKREFLPIWDAVAIRLKVCWILGTQDLDAYQGWKGTEEDAKKEKAKNIGSSDARVCFGVKVSAEHGLLVDEKSEAAKSEDGKKEKDGKNDAKKKKAK